MNHRCAQLTVLPGQEHENHYTVVDRFPFAYARSTDHLTGREDAILKRPDTDLLVIHTDSASEYWHRRASLAVRSDERRVGKECVSPWRSRGARSYYIKMIVSSSTNRYTCKD